MLTQPPPPKIKRREIDLQRQNEALQEGFDPVIARVIAGRPFLEGVLPSSLLSPKLKTLDPPHLLADMEKAVKRLITALENKEIIGIETDHDCDGQTSHAVIYCALTEFFGHSPQHLRSYIGHRLKEGYGLSKSLAQRILKDEPRPSLIITADNGSSDEAQIALLKSAGIDVIVTDHHEIPEEGIPSSAFAVINPTRIDSEYPDRFIAGCMVAWLFMAATRQALQLITHKEIPSLAGCLDFVAVGTIADCVSIARSRNNRAVVSFGMKLIQEGTRPCWRALIPFISSPFSSEDLGYKIAPMLNSDGRLACAFGSVSLLLAKDADSANQWIAHLQEMNKERKEIQEKITRLALSEAQLQYQAGKRGFCIFLKDGHAGVHGISASRVKDAFGRPVIIFCPKSDEPDILTGSARSIDRVHLRDMLQRVKDIHPDLIIRFGGHAGAAGLAIENRNFDAFSMAFENVLKMHIQTEWLGPVVWTDGELPIDKLSLSFVSEQVCKLEPFGREFEPPLFEIQGKILSITLMGHPPIHARLGILVEDLWFEAVWFNCRSPENPLPVMKEDEVKLVFSPKLQTFRGKRNLNCQVIHLETIPTNVKIGLTSPVAL